MDPHLSWYGCRGVDEYASGQAARGGRVAEEVDARQTVEEDGGARRRERPAGVPAHARL